MRKGRRFYLEAPALLCPRILLAREQNDTDLKDIDCDDDGHHFRDDDWRFRDDDGHHFRDDDWRFRDDDDHHFRDDDWRFRDDW